MRHRTSCFFILWLVSFITSIASTQALAQEQPIDLARARSYFQEAETICKRDNGKLWGRPLCGPMIFFEPRTRAVVANRSDAEGKLTRNGDLFVGRLPNEVNAANTAITWAGVKWSMIFWWNLAEDKYDRARLMVHESFHRVQEELGFPMSNPSNSHLDSLQGRVWLQLEWNALRQALTQHGRERRNSITDALIFRLYRRSLFPQADSEERALEMNEGLAEYTGVKLSGRMDAELNAFIIGRLGQVNSRPSFIRSFAYESGPAYGLLLDEADARWRRKLKVVDDFGLLLQKALSLKLPDNIKAEAEKRVSKYDGEKIFAAETKRADEKRALVAKYKAKLIDAAVLILPLTKDVNYSFNPNNLVPLDNLGTVYPTTRVTDAWGILEVTGGALMIRENNRPPRLHVPAPLDPTARSLQGEGWTLQLNDGWRLQPAERKGDYVIMNN